MRKFLLVAVVVALTRPVLAADPDFYLEPIECKNLIAYLDSAALRLVEADLPSYECFRQGNSIDCTIKFASGDRPRKGDKQTFTVAIDSPPILLFATGNWSESIMVNTAQNAAVLTSRRAELQFYGYRVCSALFATRYQIEKMRELSRKPRP